MLCSAALLGGVLRLARILVASHEVVRRLREAGYVIPVIPLLVGGQVTVWLTWPFRAVGALAGFGGMVVVCMIWRLFMQNKHAQIQRRCAPVKQLSARRVGHGFPVPPGFRCSPPSPRCWSTTRPTARDGCSA